MNIDVQTTRLLDSIDMGDLCVPDTKQIIAQVAKWGDVCSQNQKAKFPSRQHFPNQKYASMVLR